MQTQASRSRRNTVSWSSPGPSGNTRAASSTIGGFRALSRLLAGLQARTTPMSECVRDTLDMLVDTKRARRSTSISVRADQTHLNPAGSNQGGFLSDVG